MASLVNSVHSSRTLMYAELERLLASVGEGLDFEGALKANVIGKATKMNTAKTARYLRKLYLLDMGRVEFRAFLHFWRMVGVADRPLLALVFAVGNDSLLWESATVVLGASLGSRVGVDRFEVHVAQVHPGMFTPVTVHSISKNLASSWKQAGYLDGKVRNERVEVHPGYLHVALAMLLSYLHGDRGEFVLDSRWVRVLGLEPGRVRELAFEAAKRELMVFQSSGAVTSVGFPRVLVELAALNPSDLKNEL